MRRNIHRVSRHHNDRHVCRHGVLECAAPGVLSSINNCLYASVDTGTFQEYYFNCSFGDVLMSSLSGGKKVCWIYCAMNFMQKYSTSTTRVIAARHLDFVIFEFDTWWSLMRSRTLRSSADWAGLRWLSYHQNIA